jgi:hypothetical protein
MHPLDRLVEAFLARADPGDGQPLRLEQERRQLGDRRRGESSSVSVISERPSRLIRFDVDSIERTMRPFMFSFARSSSRPRKFPAARSASSAETMSRHSTRFSSRVPT